MKAPSLSLLCEWVKSSWEKVPPKIVEESFLSCAITTPIDGSQDDQIHCFKPGQPCADGRQFLAEEMEKTTSSTSNLEEDPFASDDDEDEDNTNEALVDGDSGEDDFSFDDDNV